MTDATIIVTVKARVSFRKYLTFTKGHWGGNFISIAAGDEVNITKHNDKYVWFTHHAHENTLCVKWETAFGKLEGEFIDKMKFIHTLKGTVQIKGKRK